MAEVFVVGSINQDFVLKVERRPEPGETVTDARLSTHSGGKGANQAAAAALLGAPLARDFACLTLSDLLVPWEQVETRLRALAATDLVLVLYNPRSSGRPWQLARAREVLLEHRAGQTPVGLVTDAGRDDEQVLLATLAELDITAVGMRSTVIVGGSGTARLGDWLVTAREVPT